jgi:putative FmdB family regulatory protein
MPLYEYECDACGHRLEIIQKFSDGPPDACPQCGKGPLQRQFSSPAIQFKGTGWYVTDYAGKKGASKADKSATEGGSSSGDSSSSAGEAKTDKTDKTDKSKDSAALSSPPKTAASS